MTNTTPRKYPSMMPKAEWEAPSGLAVGDIAVVLHAYGARNPDCVMSDLICGDTTVVEVKRNGTIVLANGFKFFADGYGHKANNACVISKRHALDRTSDGQLPTLPDGTRVSRPATRDGHYSTFTH